jgi:3-oxoacyl-[acyl-carrier-protein] synthase II
MKFAVTGIGIANGLGDSLEQNWANLLAGNTAIKEITWPEDNPRKFPKTHKSLTVKIGAPCPLPEFDEDDYHGEWQHWDPCVKIAVRTAKSALENSNISSKNISVIYSTTGGSLHSRAYISRHLEDGRERILPRQVIQGTADYTSGLVSRLFGLTGVSTSMHSACATGLVSLDYGLKILETEDDIDAVLVGGVDTPIEAFQSYYFQNLGALGNKSKPFDKNRTGFVVGEGSGALVIEPLEKALSRDAKIYALICSVGAASYGGHETAPDAEGKSCKNAVIKALRKAGISTTDVGLVNAHATGTVAGDDIEYNAMCELFPNAVMTANKGQIGHTLAASGIIETIYTIQSLRYQMCPPTVNLTDPIGTEIQIPTVATPIKTNYAIKNNFAFGGRSACVVIERYI